MKRFSHKQHELKTGEQKRRSLHKAYNSSSDDSSDSDSGLDWLQSLEKSQQQISAANDQLSQQSSSLSQDGATNLEFEETRVNWNMQGSIIPHRPAITQR